MLTIHDTPQDIIQAYDADEQSAEYIQGQIDFAGCWGFIDEDNINVYIAPRCSKLSIIELFAHEISHREENKLRRLKGEDFATYNAALMTEAFLHLQKVRG